MVRHDELGRLPTTEEGEQVWQRIQGRGQAVAGRPDRRKEQQRTGQLAIF